MLRLTACGCGARNLVRVDRTFWMRLVPSRRHYYCPICRTNQFLNRHAVLSALVASPPVPAPPLQAPPQAGDPVAQPGPTLPVR